MEKKLELTIQKYFIYLNIMFCEKAHVTTEIQHGNFLKAFIQNPLQKHTVPMHTIS